MTSGNWAERNARERFAPNRTVHDHGAASPRRRKEIAESIAQDCGWRDADHMRRVIAGHRELGYFGGTRVRTR